MKKQKTKKIFQKIFIPVVQILVIFVVVSYAIFYFSADRFVKNEAKEDITEAFDDIKSQLSSFRQSSATEFKLEVSTNLIDQGNDTKVYVYDKDFNDIAIFDNSIYINSEMTEFLASLLMDYELEENVLTTINFNGREYLANTYVASETLNIDEKYFVVIQDLTDKKVFIRSGLSSMIVIQVLILFLAMLVVYKTAHDLSKPITNLADESSKYVVGKGVTIDDVPSVITEVETLRVALYNMQQNIDTESKRKNTIYENVAHDLRTPLVSILGYADGLKSGIIKDKDKACNIIIKTGNQLKEMIENILILSRFDNETYKSSFEDVNINDLIKEQIDLMKVIDSDKHLTFNSTVDDDKTIYTDKKLLIRVIQNILSNAIKYANTQVSINVGAHDIVRASTASPSPAHLIISITDDGNGINDADIKNIFARYYKGDNGHFGIGLAVAKSAMSILGGDIKVTTKKGEGTTFQIFL